VDPLAEDFPGWTPYHYVHNNPINLGLVKDEEEARRRRLECYNVFLDFIHYYEDREDKPEVYWWLLKYYNCLTCPNCKECYDLPGLNGYDEYGFYFILFL